LALILIKRPGAAAPGPALPAPGSGRGGPPGAPAPSQPLCAAYHGGPIQDARRAEHGRVANR
jgi:hypothetical protein